VQEKERVEEDTLHLHNEENGEKQKMHKRDEEILSSYTSNQSTKREI